MGLFQSHQFGTKIYEILKELCAVDVSISGKLVYSGIFVVSALHQLECNLQSNMSFIIYLCTRTDQASQRSHDLYSALAAYWGCQLSPRTFCSQLVLCLRSEWLWGAHKKLTLENNIGFEVGKLKIHRHKTCECGSVADCMPKINRYWVVSLQIKNSIKLQLYNCHVIIFNVGHEFICVPLMWCGVGFVRSALVM